MPETPPRVPCEAFWFYCFVNLIARVLDLQSSGDGEGMDQIMEKTELVADKKTCFFVRIFYC